VLRPGDLVTFGSTRKISHIGIYTGEGRFIHASVKAGKVIESSITRRTSPLIRRWAGARRLLALRDSVPAS
jgi:cell wall-associated NlpC family hydrolase